MFQDFEGFKKALLSNSKPLRINQKWLVHQPKVKGVYALIHKWEICYAKLTTDISKEVSNKLIHKSDPFLVNNIRIDFSAYPGIKSDSVLKKILESEFRISYIILTNELDTEINKYIRKLNPKYNSLIKARSIQVPIKKNKRKYKNAYKPWTNREVSILKKLFKKKLSFYYIASKLGRSKTAVRFKLEDLKLIKRNHKFKRRY